MFSCHPVKAQLLDEGGKFPRGSPNSNKKQQKHQEWKNTELNSVSSPALTHQPVYENINMYCAIRVRLSRLFTVKGQKDVCVLLCYNVG